MVHLKALCPCFIFLVSTLTAFAESSYDIAALYEVIKPAAGTKVVGKYDKTIDVEYILSPTKVDAGKYIVEVKKLERIFIKLKIPIFV